MHAHSTVVARPRLPALPLPREHGTWAQLLVPLVVALGSGQSTIAGALLAVAAVLVFLASEPARILLGHRGRRRLEAHAAAMPAWLWILGGPAALCAGVALALAEPAVRVACLAPAVLGLAIGVILRAHCEKSHGGELLVAVALPAAAMPTAAANAGLEVAVAIAATFAVGFALATTAVRRVIAHRRQPTPAFRRVALAALVVGASVAVGFAGGHVASSLLAAAPMIAVAAALIAVPPHPRYLKPVGWTLAAASLATAVLLLVLLANGGA